MRMSSTESDYEYTLDPEYVGEPSASQACFCKRGVSYTPPGWICKYKRKKKSKDSTAKKLKFDN